MKRYEPKILTFSPTKKGSVEEMERILYTWTIDGWEIISVSHFQGLQPVYTVFLQREVPEAEFREMMERQA